MSTTTSGCTHVVPAASIFGTSSANGDTSVWNGSRTPSNRWPSLPAMPLPTRPRYSRPWSVSSPTRTAPIRDALSVSRRHPPTRYESTFRCGCLSQSAVRLPGKYIESRFLLTMPSSRCRSVASSSISPSSYVAGPCQCVSISPRSSSIRRRSCSRRPVTSWPSSRSTSNRSSVTGLTSASTDARRGLPTCIRSASAPKVGTPSRNATTSPSSSTSRPRSASPWSSGNVTVTSFSLRDHSRSRPSRTSTSTRMPSHLTSCNHSGPVGTRVALVASIGRMGTSCPIRRNPSRPRDLHLLASLRHDGLRTPYSRSELPMRAIWKGAVSFGLVSVPVKLYAATESHDISFRQVHAKDGGRVKYQRVCSIDGEEVAYADIAKGYETEDGEMVILTDDDMAELASTSSREIAVEKFVPSDQIDPMLLEKSYYLEPEKSGSKPYGLLRQALLDADRMAVVTVALRQRTTIAVLRVKDDVIVLQTMMWPDEVRTPDFSVETGEVKDAEVKMAHMLVETLAGDFDASEFEDDYAGAVETLVRTKIEGGEIKRTPTSTKSSGEVVDLLAALQRSVDAAKKGRGETASEIFS